MKFVAISDTHGKHLELTDLPDADCIIHAGDVSGRGLPSEVANFLQWFDRLNYTHKIFIAGNHDFFFEDAKAEEVQSIIPEGVTYLNDSGIEIEGIYIHGSPVQPVFFDWAFNRKRGEEIDQHWQLIPEHTDILITHGPAYGILDQTVRGQKVGCEDLLRRIETVKPQYHIAGHIHEAYGVQKVGDTTFVNASVVNFNYQVVNKAVEFEVESKIKTK